MPTLHNPSGFDLACYHLGLIIKAGESIDITDADADALGGGAVFVVERSAEPSAAPKRETVRRGGRRAEVTKAPRPETRG